MELERNLYCHICKQAIPYSNGAAYHIHGTIMCRECTKAYCNALEDGLAKELAIAEVERASYAEPYNLASYYRDHPQCYNTPANTAF